MTTPTSGVEMSMQAAAAQGAFLLSQYERWLTGLADVHRGLEPTPGVKTAGWLVGHLVITGDFARKLCGRPALVPKEWRALFSPGTTPARDGGAYPPMQDLVDAFHAVYRDLIAGAPAASLDTLAMPNPYEPARGAFPTAGSFVVYILTGHLGYHLGQLSMWRAAASDADASLRGA
ncbi:MAG TPA: DinB family protein [Gemmatimonadales bacterium]|nr:DinB family protein [Gemmatimonadales bacterium]